LNSIQKILLTFVNFHEKNIFYKIFFSNNLHNNHIYLYTYYNLHDALHFFKYSMCNSLTSLIDLTGVDLTGLKSYNFLTNLLTSSYSRHVNFLKIYNFIDYRTSYRYILNSLTFREFNFSSLILIYSNIGWLERELVEFFGVSISDKLDTRNLLLDYHFFWNPLLKTFPVEGYQEIYYNFTSHTLDYISAEFIEL
jgi:NADH:ubiquinone oxidoreductase subunit C